MINQSKIKKKLQISGRGMLCPNTEIQAVEQLPKHRDAAYGHIFYINTEKNLKNYPKIILPVHLCSWEIS
jgi:hypothetical protein